MFLFKRKKKEPTIELNEELENLFLTEEEKKDSKKIQHYCLERCEQILEANREIDQNTEEYRLVTQYLNDITVIEEMGAQDKKKIDHLAEGIVTLEKSKNDLVKKSKVNMDDATYRMFRMNEDEIPDAIRRLQENETWENTVKRDMQYLEAEKNRWNFLKGSLDREQKILTVASYLLIGAFAIAVVFLCTLQFGFGEDVSIGWMCSMAVACVLGVIIYVRMQNNSQEIIQSQVNANYAVSLNNKLTFKYVNIKNAVDYSLDKYKVKNSYELNYLWEQYLLATKEREKMVNMDADMDYFADRLVSELKRVGVKYPSVWVHQAEALINKKEMVEVKHNWIARRQKLRNRAAYNKENINKFRADIDDILNGNEEMSEEIQEIVKSLDKLDIVGK